MRFLRKIYEGNMQSRTVPGLQLFCSMLDSNSETLRRVLKADLHLASFDSFCWSAQVSNAFNGLQSSAMFKQKC